MKLIFIIDGMTTWTYEICECCLNNSHEKVKMVKEKLISGDLEGKYSDELWVCPVCGSTKKL